MSRGVSTVFWLVGLCHVEWVMCSVLWMCRYKTWEAMQLRKFNVLSCFLQFIDVLYSSDHFIQSIEAAKHLTHCILNWSRGNACWQALGSADYNYIYTFIFQLLLLTYWYYKWVGMIFAYRCQISWKSLIQTLQILIFWPWLETVKWTTHV